MNRFISRLLDSYGLADMHREKSKQSHFAESINPAIPIEELNLFYPEPSVPEVSFKKTQIEGNYEIGRFIFKSEITGNGVSNEYAAGDYYKNKKSDTGTSVIFVHGWRMNNFNKFHNIYLDSFKEMGFNIYTFEMPHHFSRESKTSLYNGELMVTTNIDNTLLSVKQSITDLRGFIHYLKSKNNKVVLIGISLGGFFANLTAVLEDKIDALVSVMYANSLPFAIWKSVPGKYMKQDFEAHGYTYEKLKKYWAITVPSNFKPAIPKDKILLISGSHDKYVLDEDTTLLWKTWDKPQRLIFNCGHSGIVFCKNKIRRATLEFLGEVLKNFNV